MFDKKNKDLTYRGGIFGCGHITYAALETQLIYTMVGMFHYNDRIELGNPIFALIH